MNIKTSKVLRVALLAAAYYGTAHFGLKMAIPPGIATAFWPPSGIALAALLLGGTCLWPGIWIGSFLANIPTLFDGSSAARIVISIFVVSIIALGSTLQAVLGAFLIKKITGTHNPFERVAQVFQFVIIEILSCMVAPTFGATALMLAHFISAREFILTWLTWWLGDLVGVMVITPLILTLKVMPRLKLKFHKILEIFLFFVLLIGLIRVVFLGYFPYWYVLFPFIIWAAFRFHQTGVAFSVFVISMMALWATAHGMSPSIQHQSPHESLLLSQVFVAIFMLSGMSLAVALAEQKRSEEALKQLQQNLERSNKELEQFAYAASHDLQEPLHTIGGFVQLLRDQLKGSYDPKAAEFIDYISEGVVRMSRLIDGLLTVSRVESRQLVLKPTNLNLVYQKAMSNLAKTVEENGALVTYTELPTVLADESLMAHVFQNLIANAIKYKGNHIPRIHVSAKTGKGEWIISVQDNGIGIDPAYAEKIFGMFQQLHSKQEYPGSGIGLAICKKVIERHRGKIWVEALAAKGATFYFSLPA